MTTAHRPTFDPARGGTGRGEGDLSKLSTQYSARDLPSNLKLKYRDRGQAHPDEVREKNLRYELEEKERELKDRKRSSDVAGALEDGSSAKKSRFEPTVIETEDRDLESDNDSDDDDGDDSDSDDGEELKAELEKIKKERALEKAQKEAADRAEQDRIRTEAMINGQTSLGR
uniref:Protein CWC15 homolog n=1 Tax=Panagrellus redivivus TaxID=6233 RepID=A0A7E4VR37_PANRE